MPKQRANFIGLSTNTIGNNNDSLSGIWASQDQFYLESRDKWAKEFAIDIVMWGGGGGGSQFPGGSPTWGTPAPGGAGGSLVFTGTYSDLGASSGNTLYMYVGGGAAGAPGGGGGGPNGGHPGGGGGAGPGGAIGGGGGMTSIYLNGTFSTGTRLFIAGGGGSGYFGSIATHPVAWPPPAAFQPIGLGNGGSQVSGGAGGVSSNPGYPPGNAGSQFTGGSGSPAGNGKAGGGGAGWYGGGGGCSDTGAANGAGGGGGSNYHNPIISPALVTHANFFNDPNFNPVAPTNYPIPVNPYFGPRYSNSPPFPGSRITLPGQNSGHPLYSLPYCGGSQVNGPGYPGSIHITINGVTYSYTSVGSHTLVLP